MLQYKKGNYYSQGEWKQGKGTEALFKDYEEYVKLTKEYNHITHNRWEPEKWIKHFTYLKYFINNVK